jgi:hypothetical protein
METAELLRVAGRLGGGRPNWMHADPCNNFISAAGTSHEFSITH